MIIMIMIIVIMRMMIIMSTSSPQDASGERRQGRCMCSSCGLLQGEAKRI